MQISPDPAPGIGTGAERARPERDEEVRGILDGLRALARELRVEPQGRSQGARIGPAQLRVLRLLADQPAASVSDLAQRAQADVSSASVVVSRLVESGLVRRATDADAAYRWASRRGGAPPSAAAPIPTTHASGALQRASPTARCAA